MGVSADKLDPYRAKRRATKTPEPVPPKGRRGAPGARTKRGEKKQRSAGDAMFVIQEHHARALHWDFRLERDGVLVSWAVPKGLPLDPGRNHLAVHTEDHPLEYSDFEGDIPAGEYGGGSVKLWDRGRYECEKWTEREVMVVLHGERVQGRYVLFSTARASGAAGRSDDVGSSARGAKDNWMIHRMDPAPESWEGLPELVRPMLCRTGPLPADDGDWAYEFKWDGVRAMLYVEGGRVRIVSRNDHDVSVAYPEVRALGEALGSRQAVLDGEIVALDDRGRPSFGVLQQRIHINEAARARRLAEQVPATFMAFDVVHLDGRPTIGLPYDERRRLLEALGLDGPHWHIPPAFTDVAGSDVMAAAVERGLEGVVAKRRSSTYVPGRRTDAWVKVKHFCTQEVVIGGWTPGRGRRGGGIGALLLGIPGDDGLVYVGKVGTGFSDEALDDLARRLGRLGRVTSPFVGPLPRAQVAGATWVRPALVGEVRFGEWTADGRLRHPTWRGLRPDKSPAQVVREP